MKKIIILLSMIIFLFHSCGNETRHSAQTKTQAISEPQSEIIPTPTGGTSPLRPNEKLELGKVYTDTVKYFGYDDNGDNWLFLVDNTTDTIGLIYNEEQSGFVKGEEIELQWKMDSIRYAGDPEFLHYTEYFVSAKRLKPIQLTDKKIKFLWRETHYSEEYETDINSIILNEAYIKTISEPEKAAIAYAATYIGNECSWDGKANEDRSNLKCKILWALDLGYQCSHRHLDFLRMWFRNDSTVVKELETCPTTPDGATIQDTFDEMEVAVDGKQITLSFRATAINIREGKSLTWKEKNIFEFKENELTLLKKEISDKEPGTFDVRGN